jgi:hypothetical protein
MHASASLCTSLNLLFLFQSLSSTAAINTTMVASSQTALLLAELAMDRTLHSQQLIPTTNKSAIITRLSSVTQQPNELLNMTGFCLDTVSVTLMGMWVALCVTIKHWCIP